MATCPACKGMRIRDDYKPAPLALRLLGLRALLCDYCNHQFRAFSPLPPKSGKPRALQRKADIFNAAPSIDLNRLDLNANSVAPAQMAEPSAATEPPSLQLKIDLDHGAPPPAKEPLWALAQAAGANQTEPASNRVLEGLEARAQQCDLKTEIAKTYAEHGQQTVASAPPLAASKLQDTVPRTPICPECGSTEVRRRHRTAIERAALSLTQHKAFICGACKASFYAKPDESAAASNLADA